MGDHRTWAEFVLPRIHDGCYDAISRHAVWYAAERWTCVVTLLLLPALFGFLRYVSTDLPTNLTDDAAYLLPLMIVVFLRFKVVDWLYMLYWYDERTVQRRVKARSTGIQRVVRAKAHDYQVFYDGATRRMLKGGTNAGI